MSRFRRINELERLDLVLQDVGEGDETTLAGIDGADILNAVAPVIEAKDGIEPVVLALLVGELGEKLRVGLLTEGEGRRGNVFGVVVVDCGGADRIVLKYRAINISSQPLVHRNTPKKETYPLSFDVPGATILWLLRGQLDVCQFHNDLQR